MRYVFRHKERYPTTDSALFIFRSPAVLSAVPLQQVKKATAKMKATYTLFIIMTLFPYHIKAWII